MKVYGVEVPRAPRRLQGSDVIRFCHPRGVTGECSESLMSGSTPRSKRCRRATTLSGRSTHLTAPPTSPTGAEDPPTDEEEGPTAYDLLVSSLQPVKRAKVERGDDGERSEGVAMGVEGERSEGVAVGAKTSEVAEETDEESSSDDESKDEGIVNDEGKSNLGSGRGLDPFTEHVEQDLSEAEVASLHHALAQPLRYEQAAHPVLGLVGVATCLPSRASHIRQEEGLLPELHVRRRLATLWSTTQDAAGDQAPLTPLQHHLFAIMNSYKDLLFTRRTFDNAEAVRRTYVLHALNHLLKTRSRVLKNNSRLALASREGRDITELRDQGLTRPRVLILLPFREAALRTVNCIISLLLPQGQGQVSHRRRLQEEFGEPQGCIPPVTPKPASFQAMFAGNIDDCFRLGLAVGRNTVKLYSEFYKSDIILASPLGLRTIIGAEGEKKRDFDFLSSLELLVVDQADVFLMQNWEHLTHVFHHLHHQPQDSHGVDFSRVRLWALNGWGQYYRQSLVFSSFPTPEINAVFKKYCLNYAGKVRVSEPSLEGSVRQVVTQVPQLFRRIQVSSFSNLPDIRFTYFIEQVLPEYRGELMKQTAIFIPSYFDFVRIRNYMKKEGLSFAQICEYSKTSDISRARTLFLQGRRHFLLLTERVHFFRRLWVKGAHHLLFFSLPTYPEFYPEVVNLLEGGGATCTVLYTHYDSLSLARVVGGDRAPRMLEAEDSSCMLVTGE